MTGGEPPRTVLPYGTWPSPVTPRMLTAGTAKFVDVWIDDASGTTVWQEARPTEGGRQVLVALGSDGAPHDVLPPPFNARSGAHEYGGGAAHVADGRVWFVDWADQRIWSVPLDGSTSPIPITPDSGRRTRYADLRRAPDGRHLAAVRERHADDGTVTNDLVVVPADGAGEPLVVFDRSDFVMSPCFVGDDRIRFVAWNHPEMPWTVTTLVECRIDTDRSVVGDPMVVASGASFMQPVDDRVISDRSGWWNLWRIDADGETPLVEGATDMGGPAWVFGLRDHAVLPDGRVVWTSAGRLGVGERVHDTGAALIEQVTASHHGITAIVRWFDRDAEIVRFDPDDPSRPTVLVGPPHRSLADDDVSRPEPVTFPTSGGATAHGWFHPPVNSGVRAPEGTLPPLVVMIHGGPTSAARPWFSLGTQFWTTRGFAVVDVDHRGSTGYGTTYRNLLDGNWGVVDVEDCLAAARWLADTGRVDGDRMVIRGGSAGGFTVLSCLAHGDVFATGSCSYGIADLSVLATDTHKFESRYTDRLIGPWPAARAVYEERSPIHHLEAFTTPLIVFQGLDDRVVPPNQSEMIVAALRARGVECEYHAYPGEGHGFRQAATIEHQLTSELAFYRRVLGLDGA